MMSLRQGARLGPYEILASIGAGGMGEVYKARDTRLGREVAVKVLPADVATDPERLRRFEQEARAAAALNHPNILVLYDIGTHEGAPYLVTELLEGETLRQRLRGGQLATAKLVDFGVQIAHGLAAAHEKGIIHRDLKPENLFVTKDGHLKILDFGLARLRPEADGKPAHSEMPTSDGPTRQGMVLGTVGYMAPEQVRGQPADARSDLFAFGCVLYEMVSGKQAFMRETSAETMTAILREEPPELAGTGRPVPPGLERIVRRCLEKRPEERFQSARDLAFGLEAFSGLTGTASGPALAGPKSGRRFLWSGRPWIVAGALGVTAILGGVAGSLIHWTVAHPSQPVFHQLTFRRGSMWGARFSPDGKEVFYCASWDGKPREVFSVRPGSPESRPLGFESLWVTGVFPNGDLLVCLPNSNLAQAPINGGVPREIVESAVWSDAGSDAQHICVIRAESGVNRLEYPVGKVLCRTSEGLFTPRLSNKGDRVAFVQGNSIMVVDTAGKAVCLSKRSGQINGLAWTPSGGEVWFTAFEKGVGWALYAVTLGGRERLVYRSPGMLLLADISADGRVLFDRVNARYGFAAWDAKAGEERDLSWLDGSNLGVLSADGSRVLFHEDMEAARGKVILYMRGTDGSPPARLGEGYPCDISSNGEWVISLVRGEKGGQLQLIPTGAGQPRALTKDGLDHRWARWMPDGKQFVFFGNEPGHKPRFYVQSVGGGAPRPLTPEGKYLPSMAVSPDGRDLAYCDLDKEEVFLVSTDGGEPRPLPGKPEIASPNTFSADGKSLLIGRRKVFRVDLKTGQKKLVREIKPADPAGFSIEGIQITPDEKAYAYGYYRELSDLFVAEGLK